MKSTFTTVFIIVLASLIHTGCADREAEEKARAEAARKEMEQLPKTFSTPDYYKKNEPNAPATPNAAPSAVEE